MNGLYQDTTRKERDRKMYLSREDDVVTSNFEGEGSDSSGYYEQDNNGVREVYLPRGKRRNDQVVVTIRDVYSDNESDRECTGGYGSSTAHEGTQTDPDTREDERDEAETVLQKVSRERREKLGKYFREAEGTMNKSKEVDKDEKVGGKMKEKSDRSSRIGISEKDLKKLKTIARKSRLSPGVLDRLLEQAYPSANSKHIFILTGFPR